MNNSILNRNSPCPCGSGQKYKYCCIGNRLKEKLLPIWQDSESKEMLSLDMTNDIMNWEATSSLPIKHFCKDNDIYYFELALTVGESKDLTQKLKKGILTKKEVIEVYKKNCSKKFIMSLLKLSCSELQMFKEREEILFDAFEAHFIGKYTLSIPTLFTQFEGLLRVVGNLQNKDSIQPTIPIDIWDNKLLFGIKDSAQNFRAFIQNLFSGSVGSDKFNRNPILHGFKIDYYCEEHSLLIILAILEIRLFEWCDINTIDYTKRFEVSIEQ